MAVLYLAAGALVVGAADVSKKETAKGEGGEGTPASRQANLLKGIRRVPERDSSRVSVFVCVTNIQIFQPPQ